ncbi:methyltransferase domain-containing protein [Kitasatospora sp. NPDC089797]|uniref:class I SAM-dependent methyltransferase n=1 Tax=Kitasatospora sp. NPDC089797 TaxID=3155298 RepID=UPI0034236A98
MTTEELDLAGLRRMYTGNCWLSTLTADDALHWGWTEPGQSKWRLRRAQRQAEDVLGRKLALPPGARVLDVGCGTGAVARTMAGRFGLTVTGIDILEDLLARARRAGTPHAAAHRVTFRCGDFHQLPFEEGGFDGLYSMEAFPHSYDPPRALGEFHRVLRPGGRLVLLGPVRREPGRDGTGEPPVPGPRPGARVPAGMRVGPADGLSRLLAEAGFEVEEALDATRHYRPTTEALHAVLRLPWAALRRFGSPDRWLNIRTVRERYDAREVTGWYVHTAVKPSR